MTSVKFVDSPETAVLDAAKHMLRRGLVEGTAGNISARRSDGNIVITPSSVDYRDMQLDDLVLVDPEGAVLRAADGRFYDFADRLGLGVPMVTRGIALAPEDRKREAYEKPSVKRKKKDAAARKRATKKSRPFSRG